MVMNSGLNKIYAINIYKKIPASRDFLLLPYARVGIPHVCAYGNSDFFFLVPSISASPIKNMRYVAGSGTEETSVTNNDVP